MMDIATAKEPKVEMVPLGSLHPASEAPEELRLVVRRAPDNEEAMAQLQASIGAVGVLSPLLVKKHKGKNYVAAGNRRLAALRSLANGSGLEVPTIDITAFDCEPREVALMHNIALPPHPIDQFEVVSGLIADGMRPDDVAARYGYTPRRVAQIMAYGNLHADVRDAWRAGDMGPEDAAAFTLAEPDHQAKVLKKLRKQGWRLTAREIKGEIIGAHHDIGRLLEFIGLDTYEAAGGHVHRDLFGIDHRASDQKLAKKMADERLERECEALMQSGWAWAKAPPGDSYSYGTDDPAKLVRTPEQSARLKELKADLGDDARDDDEFVAIEAEVRLASFSAEEKSRLGCFVSISREGRLKIEAGRREPSARSAASSGAGKKAAAADKPTTPAEKKKAERERLKKAEAGEVSKKLDHELAVALREATKAALGTVAKEWAKSHPLASTISAVLADLIKPDDKWNAAVSDKQMEAIRAAMDPDIMNTACGNAFDAKSYFGSISKLNLVAVIKEAINEDEARKAAELSKADIEKFAIKNVPDTGWLPVQLRTPSYDGPGSAKPRKRTKR